MKRNIYLSKSIKQASLLCVSILGMSMIVTSCNKEDPLLLKYEDIEIKNIDDNYRNFYQIFPISYADSNKDGRGDFQGIIDKLDYIEGMHYNGIWLNPIHPSSTSHCYDVEDYLKVDQRFGTIEKFDELVTKCHERNIKLIIDMVINHSSNKHPWFTDSYVCAKNGRKTRAEYYRYNWIDCSGAVPSGYSKVSPSDSVAYESRFDKTMPDLNLEQVITDGEGDMATLLKNIFKFWLVDHKVDGFRLDAVTSYFTNNNAKNLQMLTWINDTCKALKPNCYIVGEGDWGTNSSVNKNFQASGIDSFFQFGNCAKNNGYVSQAVNTESAKMVTIALTNNQKTADTGIEAPFLGNHDTSRYVGSVSGRKIANNAKFALGLLQQLKGSTFTYYGDEVGMGSQGTDQDGFYRLPLRWGDDYTTKIGKIGGLYGVGSEKDVDESLCYPHKTVAEQEKDSNSILNYAKKANLIRLQFPEIARGTFEEKYSEGSALAVIKRTYKGSTIHIAINASKTETKQIDYSLYGENVVAELCTSGNIRLTAVGETKINIPPQSIAIIR